MQVEINKLSFMQQFHFGVFYSYIKLREQEHRNIVWIAECIAQRQPSKIDNYIPIFWEPKTQHKINVLCKLSKDDYCFNNHLNGHLSCFSLSCGCHQMIWLVAICAVHSNTYGVRSCDAWASLTLTLWSHASCGWDAAHCTCVYSNSTCVIS